MEFDEISIKDEIELINIQRQMKQSHLENNQTFGFNTDKLYETIEDKD